jgi:hypothetical protein
MKHPHLRPSLDFSRYLTCHPSDEIVLKKIDSLNIPNVRSLCEIICQYEMREIHLREFIALLPWTEELKLGS